MKRMLAALSIFSLVLTSCGKTANDTAQNELPAIVFIVRTDISDTLGEMSDEEIAQRGIAVESLAFYDKEGNYYSSRDPDVNAMDNKTLITEYEAGHLTEQLQYYTSCDADALADQYAKLLKIYRKGKLEIVYPHELPAVQANFSAWYGFYYDRDGNIQSCTIHQEERMTELYTNNDKVNEVYEWIKGTFKKAEQSQ